MRKASSLLVSRVAQDLRKQAFAATPGSFLGSEAALVEQYNVSRPTFRQAAKLVEQEQLLVIKPGSGGGYFVRQPDSAAVAHMTGVYLQSRNTTPENLVTAFIELYIDLARISAGQHHSAAALARFNEFTQREKVTLNDPMDWKAYACSHVTFVDILANMSGNPLMKLFFDITTEMTKHLFDSLAPLKPASIHVGRAERLKLMDAIRDGQPDVAEKLARTWTEQVSNWLLNKLN